MQCYQTEKACFLHVSTCAEECKWRGLCWWSIAVLWYIEWTATAKVILVDDPACPQWAELNCGTMLIVIATWITLFTVDCSKGFTYAAETVWSLDFPLGWLAMRQQHGCNRMSRNNSRMRRGPQLSTPNHCDSIRFHPHTSFMMDNSLINVTQRVQMTRHVPIRPFSASLVISGSMQNHQRFHKYTTIVWIPGLCLGSSVSVLFGTWSFDINFRFLRLEQRLEQRLEHLRCPSTLPLQLPNRARNHVRPPPFTDRGRAAIGTGAGTPAPGACDAGGLESAARRGVGMELPGSGARRVRWLMSVTDVSGLISWFQRKVIL